KGPRFVGGREPACALVQQRPKAGQLRPKFAACPHASRSYEKQTRHATVIYLRGLTAQGGSVVHSRGRFIDLLVTLVDRDSDAELSDVEIRAVPFDPFADPAIGRSRCRSASVLLPPRDDPHLEIWRNGVPSPILIHRKELESWDLMAVYAHAPRHAWCPFDLEQKATSQAVSLPAAAGLAVTVLNPPVRPESFLRLRSTAEGETPGRLMHEQQVDVTKPRMVLEDIQPFRLAASVELGFDQPLVLAQDVVDLAPGQLTSLVLHYSPAPELPAAVIVAGTLFVPPAWGDDLRPSLSLTLVDCVADVEESSRTIPPGRMLRESTPGMFLWKSEPILPGRCRAFVSWSSAAGPQGWQVLIDISPQGDPAVRLEVPPPAELIVNVFLAEKKGYGPYGDLMWSAGTESSGGMRGGGLFFEEPIRMLVPIGPVRLKATRFESSAVKKAERVVQVGPGRNETTLDLR
ncbi:MAG: hypothetical protein HY812_06750, partial [Planctomycetes bacterium]|nr:hypothetical protein [Planctomycetota bacterium]